MNVKQIENFNYLITDEGDVISMKLNKPICQWVDNVGYKQVKLFKDGKKCYKRVHRLVAEAFLPNELNLPQVNHIDGDKLNNNISNLEWCDNKENTQHGYDNKLYHSKRRSIKINVYNKNNGEYICTYKSIRETADKLHINRKTLSRILFEDKENNYDYKFEAILD